jgi:uncharacterized membrane protein
MHCSHAQAVPALCSKTVLHCSNSMLWVLFCSSRNDMRSLVSVAALLLLVAGASAGACYSKCTATSSSSELGQTCLRAAR